MRYGKVTDIKRYEGGIETSVTQHIEERVSVKSHIELEQVAADFLRRYQGNPNMIDPSFRFHRRKGTAYGHIILGYSRPTVDLAKKLD